MVTQRAMERAMLGVSEDQIQNEAIRQRTRVVNVMFFASCVYYYEGFTSPMQNVLHRIL